MKRPMKGAAVDDFEVVRFPCIGMPKVDGFRAVLGLSVGGAATSRLSPFPNVSFMNQTSGLIPKRGILDCEATCGIPYGPGVLGRTSSGLTTETGNPDWYLHAFDTYEPGLRYVDRLENVKILVRLIGSHRIKALEYRWLYNLYDFEEYLSECLERGFEGIITRDPTGPYKEGKSTLREQYMLKVKPFDTAEGKIKGWFEEMENTNEAKREVTGKLKRSSSKSGKVPKGRLGGFILDDIKDGVEVRVGGGFTQDQRIRLWPIREQLIGELVRYKKQRVGQKDKPRHPNFLEFVDFRPIWDMTDD